MSLATWKAQFLDEEPAPPRAPVYVCALCQRAFAKATDHDFDICAYQFRMELLWRQEKGDVIHAN